MTDQPYPPPGAGYPQPPGHPPPGPPTWGHPPAQPSGYPPDQASGHQSPPPGYPPGYPSAHPSGYPPAQQPGYPPSQPPFGYPGYPPPPGPPRAPNGRPLAGLGRRYVARMVDQLTLLAFLGVSLGAIVFVLYQVASEPSATTRSGTSLTTGGSILWGTALIGLPLTALYVQKVELCLRLGGQTIGKRMLGIAIAPLDPRRPLTRAILFRRGVVDALAGLFSLIYVGLINLLWALWDKPYRQCLHDKAADTVVVDVR